jgi:hypothetical protein
MHSTAEPWRSPIEEPAVYEHRSARVLRRRKFLVRFAQHTGFAFCIILGSLYIGVLGYREFESMSWTDALLNASMILGGMGPVDPLKTETGKLFASAYALYSGVVFLTTTAIVMAPLAHRLLHQFHAESQPQ